MYQYVWSTLEDKPEDAFALREKVFMCEQGFAYDRDETDKIAYHLTMYHHGDQVIGAARMYEEQEGTYHFGRICVEKSNRGKGIGSLLMTEMERKTKELGATRVVISAQVTASPFYLSLGYHKQGEIYLEEGCKHIFMSKSLE